MAIAEKGSWSWIRNLSARIIIVFGHTQNGWRTLIIVISTIRLYRLETPLIKSWGLKLRIHQMVAIRHRLLSNLETERVTYWDAENSHGKLLMVGTRLAKEKVRQTIWGV